MPSVIDQLNETVAFIKSRCASQPQTGIVLGSGLGNFLSEITIKESIPYQDIPHFPVSTVEGHEGSLVFGELMGREVAVMAGRFHYYEGYSPQDVVYPIRTLKFLGIDQLLLSNAAGGVNTSFKVGDLMIINDHISMSIINPLIGKNEEALGTRFPDMSEPYSKHLIGVAKKAGEKLGIKLKEGVYYGVTGPTFETHAEYRMIKLVGADVVGMSTVQESIVAVHMGMKVLAISVVTDMGIRNDDSVITHEEVLQAAQEAEPKLTALFKEIVGNL
ncbi:MAG: purine-nucleoside phosphorylase [Sphingobacteriales bacterium]|nr:MAG: purine-nucleoside phosphorylase [Sphingobacteriales bacterium]